MAHFLNTPYTPQRIDELTKIQDRSDYTDMYLKNTAVPDGEIERVNYTIKPNAPFYFNILFRIGTKAELKKKFIDGGLYPGEIGVISDTKQMAYKFVDYRTQEEQIAIIGAKSQSNDFKDYLYNKLTGSNFYLPKAMPTKLDQTPTVNIKKDKTLEFVSYDDGNKEFHGTQTMNKVSLFGARNGQFVIVNKDGTIQFKIIPHKFEDDRIVENVNGIATFKTGGVVSINDLGSDLLADINNIINMQASNISYTPKVITDINNPIIIDDTFNLTSLSVPLYFSSEVIINSITLDKFIMDVTTNSNDLTITNNMTTPSESIDLKANTQYRLFKGINNEIIALIRYANIMNSNNSNIAFVSTKDDILSKNKVITDDNIISKIQTLYEIYESKINTKRNFLNEIGFDLSSITDNELYLFNYDGKKFTPNNIDFNTYSSLLLNEILVNTTSQNSNIQQGLVNTFKKFTNVANSLRMTTNVANNIPVDFNSIVLNLEGYTPSDTTLIVDNDNISGDVIYDVTIRKHDDMSLDDDINDIIIVELETTQRYIESSTNEIFLNYNKNKYVLTIKDTDSFIEDMNINNLYNIRDNLKGNYTSDIYCTVTKSVAGIDLKNTGLLIKRDDEITTEHVYNARFSNAAKITNSNVKLEYKREILSYSIEPIAGKVISLNIDDLLSESIGNVYYLYLNTDIESITIESIILDKRKIFVDLSKGKVLIIKLANLLGKHSFSIVDEDLDINKMTTKEREIRTTVGSISDIDLYGQQMTNITGYIDDIRLKDIKNNLLFIFPVKKANDVGMNRYFVDKDYFIKPNTVPIYYDTAEVDNINRIEFDCNVSVIRTKHSLFSILVDVEYKTYLNDMDNIKEDRYLYNIVPSNIMDFELSNEVMTDNPIIKDISMCRTINEHIVPLVNYITPNSIIYPTGQFLHSNPLDSKYINIRLNDNEFKQISSYTVSVVDNETGEILLDYRNPNEITRLLGEVNIRIAIDDTNIIKSNKVFTSAINFGSFKIKVDLTYADASYKTISTDIYISKNYGKEVLELFFDHSDVNGNYISGVIPNKSENNYGMLLYYKTTADIDIKSDKYIIQDIFDEKSPLFISNGLINSPVYYILPVIIKNTTGKKLVLADFEHPISTDYIYKVSSITKTLHRLSFYENNIMSNYINNNNINFNLSNDYYYIIEKNIFTKGKSNSILNFNNGIPFTDDGTLVKITKDVDDLIDEFYSFDYYKKVDDNNYYLMSHDGDWYKYVLKDNKIIERNALLKIFKYKQDNDFTDTNIISYGTSVYCVCMVNNKLEIFITDGINIQNTNTLKFATVSFIKSDNTRIEINNVIVPTTLDTTLDVQISSNSQITRDIYFVKDNNIYYQKTVTDTVKEMPKFKILI